MGSLGLHQFHESHNARFGDLNGQEVVTQFDHALLEHRALSESAGVLDLSFRGRVCLVGADRVRFLHGQVTNDVNALNVGQGCYAALITAKGRMISDLNIYRLENELLLDFEPGLTAKVIGRLEQYVIADDVQLIDVAPDYGLLSVQGPEAGALMKALGLQAELPAHWMHFVRLEEKEAGEVYVVNQPRLGTAGFDLFIPSAVLEDYARRLTNALHSPNGLWCGWQAFEIARIEAGLPRFGADMDESNLPPEAGLEARAISYSKGCYIGQEIIARIRTYGQVAKTLCGLRLADDVTVLPSKGDPLFKGDKEVGRITSAAVSPAFKANLALGYVHREANAPGTELTVRTRSGESIARVVRLPLAEKFA